MKNTVCITAAMLVALAILLSLPGGNAFAANGRQPMKPELAAKREMVRSQQEQRITHTKRKAAAESLKAERLRLYNAKRGIAQPAPQPAQ